MLLRRVLGWGNTVLASIVYPAVGAALAFNVFHKRLLELAEFAITLPFRAKHLLEVLPELVESLRQRHRHLWGRASYERLTKFPSNARAELMKARYFSRLTGGVGLVIPELPEASLLSFSTFFGFLKKFWRIASMAAG